MGANQPWCRKTTLISDWQSEKQSAEIIRNGVAARVEFRSRPFSMGRRQQTAPRQVRLLQRPSCSCRKNIPSFFVGNIDPVAALLDSRIES